MRELAAILNETGLTEIEVERGGLKIRVAKQLTAAPTPATRRLRPPAAAAAPPAPLAAAGGRPWPPRRRAPPATR